MLEDEPRLRKLEIDRLVAKLALLHRVHEGSLVVVWDVFPDTLPSTERDRDPQRCLQELADLGYLAPVSPASPRDELLGCTTAVVPPAEAAPAALPEDRRDQHRALAHGMLAADPGAPFAKDLLAEALVQQRGAQEWDALESGLFRHFMDLLGTHDSSLTKAFGELPAEVLRGRPGLQFGASAASAPIDKGLIHATTGTDLAARFGMLVTEVGQAWSRQDSADGVVFLGALWIVWLRKHGDLQATEDAAAGLLLRLRELASEGDVPSRTNLQWFEVERGLTALFALDWGRARTRFSSVHDMAADFAEYDAYVPLLASALLELQHSLSGQPAATTLHVTPPVGTIAEPRQHSEYIEYVCQLSAARVALDRLDLQLATQHIAYLNTHQLSSEFWEIAAETSQLLDVLTDSTQAIQARQAAIVGAVAKHHRSAPLAHVVRVRSRVDALIAVGQLERARALCERTPELSTWLRVSYARLHLIGGRFARTAVLSQAIAADDRATSPERATAHGLAAAAYDAEGDHDAALEQVRLCLSWCIASATLLPVALLPRSARERLLHHATETEMLQPLASALHLSVAELLARCATLGQCFPDTGVLVDLTKREGLVLHMLDSGLSQAEIAAQLSVSVSTLKKQTGSIYRKLGVGSRREALHIAHVHGLIDGIQAAQAAQSGQRR